MIALLSRKSASLRLQSHLHVLSVQQLPIPFTRHMLRPASALERAQQTLEQDEFDSAAWHTLFQQAQKLSVAEAREHYDRFLATFPTASAYWKLYIDHELQNRNYAQVEELFRKCLMPCNDVALYQTYLNYMKERKTSEELDTMYKFVLERCGDDFHATPIWKDYISYVSMWHVHANKEYVLNDRKIWCAFVYWEEYYASLVRICCCM